MFSKKEKSSVKELHKKSIMLCKDSVKEIDELYDDMKSSYEDIETITAEFLDFVNEITPALNKEAALKMTVFSKQIAKIDQCARNGVRDVRDILRNQKKRLAEINNDLK